MIIVVALLLSCQSAHAWLPAPLITRSSSSIFCLLPCRYQQLPRCGGRSWLSKTATRSTEADSLGRGTNHRRIKRLNLDDNAVPILRRLLLEEGRQEDNDKTWVQVEGYLISKRGFGPSFCFMDISRRGVQVPVQAMLKRQSFENANYFDGFMKSLVPGIRLILTGPVAHTRNPGEAVLLVKDVQIDKLPHNPQHVRKLLKLVSDGFLEANHLVPSCKNWTKDALLQGIEEAKTKLDPGHPKVFHNLAKRILEDLNEEQESDAEYPEFSNDHKYTNSLPAAPRELTPPALVSDTAKKDVSTEQSELKVWSVESILKKHLRNQEEHSNDRRLESLCLSGWVQNRRRFRGSISTLEVVDVMVPAGNTQQADPDSIWKQRLKCILHPNVLAKGSNNNKAKSEVLGQLLAPGCQVRLQGYIILPTNTTTATKSTDVPTFWIHRTNLLRSSWRPNVVQFLVEQVYAKRVEIEEAAPALHVSHQELERIASLDDLTKRQWESTEMARRLQCDSADLSLHMDPSALKVLDDLADLRAARPLKLVNLQESSVTRNDFVSTQGSRWKRKKEPQLEWMTQQVERVLQRSYPGKFEDGKATLRILDIGGGKGFLANHLAQRLAIELGYQVKILVVDVAEGAIKNGRLRTARRNLSHMVEYAAVDASTLDNLMSMDLVVALHACGALTDVALGHAVEQQAAFVVCPCCFRSNPELQVPVRRDGIESVTVADWLSVKAGDFEKLKGLAEVQGDLNLANRAIHTLCALRASAVEQHASVLMRVSIETFPVAFSTRNFCLVGERRG